MGVRRFLPDEYLTDLLRMVPGERKVTNVRSDDSRMWELLEEADPADVNAGLRGARPFYSAKGVLMPVTEVIARYGQAEGEPLDEAHQVTMAVIGVRGCECRALTYLDRIMLDEPMADPFYEARRGNAFIVGVDCAVAADSCFCDLLGDVAYPEVNFDLSLSPVEGGFLVEAGSDAGQKVLEQAASLLSDATDEHASRLEAMRQETADRLAEQNAEFEFPDDFVESLPATLEELFWRVELGNCVQCGGCTNVCPQCYCFLMSDKEVRGGAYERGRAWDSCQFTGYSEMAGLPGTLKPDPRRDHMSKFQHRFAHKFWYNPLMLGILGCVGCGRCGDTCPGAIDLRRVLTNVNKERVHNA
ncbi:MAG: 4Fe-4S dicluster domain-containing protein [Planctomycetota bacterium]|jgi:ferredoxin